MTAFSPSRACADFGANLSFSDIPLDVVDRMKRDLLDWCGCAIKGSRDPASKPAREVEQLLGWAREAGVFGEPYAADFRSAAFMNGYYGHINEMDDVDRASISHPATCVIPAALSLSLFTGDSADAKAKNGADILTAVTAGFEVMLRIGAAITPAHYKIFHTTATTGPFGAAAAGARILGLSPERTLWAIGNAGSCAAGLWQFNPDGAMTKFMHAGNAAGNGVFTALLARAGFSGPAHVLEGGQGFFAGFARQEPKIEFLEDFGKYWRAGAVSFKPYPCCRHTHSAIDAGIALHKQLEPGETITKLKLHTYSTALSIAGKTDPQTGREGKFSITYCVASAIVRGVMRETDFTEEAVQDPRVKAIEQVTEVIDDPAINACVPKNWPCRIEAVTSRGRELSAQIQAPTGDPENEVSWDQLADKFRMMTDGILKSAIQDEFIACCRSFESAGPGAGAEIFRIANAK